MADAASPSGSERRGSARGGPPARPATAAGNAPAKSVRQPPPSRRRATASVSQRLADHAELPSPPEPPAAPAKAAPPAPSLSAARRTTPAPAATAPVPPAAPAAGAPRQSRPLPPASRRGGNPPGAVTESQPQVRPLSHRTLRNAGTGLTAPVSAPINSAAPVVVPPAAPSRPRTSRRLGPPLDPAQLDLPANPAARRPLDVSNRYREERAASARKNKRFGLILMIAMTVLLVGSAVGLYIGYRIVKGEGEHQAEVKAAFNNWLTRQTNDLRPRIDAATTALRPVFEDLPSGRSTPEQTAALNARYASALRAVGADYIWCRKTWKNGNQNLSTNLSLDGASTFLLMPASAKLLSPAPVVLPNLNGERNQSGTLVLYWDLDHHAPIAVVTLVLAPPTPTPVAGQPPPELIPPTQFTMWYTLPALDELVQEYVDGPTATEGGAR